MVMAAAQAAKALRPPSRRQPRRARGLLHLVGELRIVGQIVRSEAMRPELMGTPDALNRTDRDADGRGHGAGGPVRRFMGRLVPRRT